MFRLNSTRADQIYWTLLVSLSLFNLTSILMSPLNLSPDEAHYWDWSRRLDWSYYSKGPLVAYLIYFSRVIFGDTAFAVRFPAFLCFTLFSMGVYAFLRRYYLPSGALLGFIIVRSSLIFVQTGILMTTDAPAVLLWFLALVAAYLAIVEEKRPCWILFGLFVGLGVLAKYTLLFLPASVLAFLLFDKRLWRHLRSWELWLGGVVFALLVSPILIWNYQHDWVNLAHNAGHVVKSSGATLSYKFLPELLLGQLGLVGPILFVFLCASLIFSFSFWKREGDLAAGLFAFSSIPLGIFVLTISLAKRIYANWPAPIYVGCVLALIHLFNVARADRKRYQRIFKNGVVLSAVLSFLAHMPLLGFTFGLPGKILPTKKLVGWNELGELVDKTLATEDTDAFVLTDDYELVATISFYAQSRPEVYCALLDDRRMNQYDIWGGWEKLKGRNALVVLRDPARIESLRPYFSELRPISDAASLVVEYGGAKLNQFYLYRAQGYDGYAPPWPLRR